LTATGKLSPAPPGPALDHERIAAFYRQAPYATRTNAMLAAVTLLVMWNEVPGALLAGWAGAVALAHVVRMGLYFSYVRDAGRAGRPLVWANRCAWAMLLTGLVWGAGGVAMFQPDEPLHLAFWLIALCGIAAGVVTANAFHLPATYAYLLPLLAPIIVRLSLEGGWAFNSIAVGMLLFLGFALVQSRHQAALFAESIAMRLENLELVRRLQEEKNQADAARTAAEEAGRAKARFLAAASHDLRQPLHALGLFSAALREQEAEPQRRALVDRVSASVEALEELFDGVLDLARLDAGVQPRRRHFEAAPTLARLQAQFAIEAHRKGLAFRTAGVGGTLFTDPIMFERMLGNLIANAVRYTESGAIMLACRARDRHWLIQVRDSGRGIAPEEQARVFEEFYQVGNPERDRANGLGIGLATVQRMGEALGIAIGLRSCPGAGTTFSLLVPAGDPSLIHAAPSEHEAVPDDALRGKRILVLDDEASIREAMSELLRHWGAEPETAEDLDGCRSASRERPFDLVIADYRLRRGASGVEAIAALRAAQGDGLRALLVTGDSAPESVRAIHQSGLTVLSKPVRPVELRAALTHLLRQPA